MNKLSGERLLLSLKPILMENQKFFKFFYIVILLIFFCLNFCTASLGETNFKLVDKVVAVVGDQFLTLYELKLLCKPFLKRLNNENVPPEEKEKIIKDIEKKVLESWIEDTIVQQEAKKYGISVSDEEVKNYIKNEIRALGGEKAFKKFLKDEGLSFKEYKEKIKKRLLAIKFVQLQVHQKVLITDQDLKEAYQEYVKRFKSMNVSGYKYVISILKSRDENIIKKAYILLKSGKNLEDVAKVLSNKVKFIPEVSYFKKDLSKEVLDILDKLNKGEISSPIKIGDNYFIIKLLNKGKVNPLPFSQVKKHLYQELFQKEAQKFVQKLIEELKEKRYVKIFSF